MIKYAIRITKSERKLPTYFVQFENKKKAKEFGKIIKRIKNIKEIHLIKLEVETIITETQIEKL